VIGTLTLYHSMIGKKVIMAVSGIILWGYVLLHMLGNLKIFTGAEHFNEYAVWLREVGQPFLPHEGLLWIIRLILLAALILHVVSGVQVAQMERAARPTAYAVRKNLTSSPAGRSMFWGGLAIGLFIIYHLLHFTFGVLQSDFQGYEQVYHNVVVGFSNPIVSLIYIAAMVALGLHLYHGLWSMAQTLHWRSRRSHSAWLAFATAFAVLIAGGNILIPLAVLLGIVHL
jgi:succinate dehydrogenase / fumarate reductase cytochrome b subunit